MTIKKYAKYFLGILTCLILSTSLVYATNKVFSAKNIIYNNTDVNTALDRINSLQEKENNSCKNVSMPNLGTSTKVGEKLVPVIIEKDGSVKKASSNNKNNSWYNYCDKRWANAVILNVADTFSEGATIPEKNIESYFVWIPKYKYQLWNVDTTSPTMGRHSINIIFDETNTTDTNSSCATPMTSGGSGNCKNGDYMTHPAFISLGVKGFWVGKFETGYKSSTNLNSNNPNNVQIKPNIPSWRNINVSNMFNTAFNYKKVLNSHMMKNTEWGAVAYLSHSVYGVNYEIRRNNHPSYMTGYAAVGEYTGANYGLYNTDTGYTASTSDNISGIYDMSGGAYDAVAAHIDGSLKDSGFTESSISAYNTKYFDVYKSDTTETKYENRILGDATGELAPMWKNSRTTIFDKYQNYWYDDGAVFVNQNNPWFLRGDYIGEYYHTGQFAFTYDTGVLRDYLTFRIVLAP